MGGVDHAEDAPWARRILTQIEQDVAGDALVGSVTPDAVAARKIEQLHLLAMLADELARLLLDGDSGIVADFLAKTGECVEERGLAAVGVADDGVGFGADFGCGCDAGLHGAVMGNGDCRFGDCGDDVGGWCRQHGGALGSGLGEFDHHLRRIGTADT